MKCCTVFIIHRLINVKCRCPTFIITLACNCASILRRKTPSDDEMQIAKNEVWEKVVPSNNHFSKMPSSMMPSSMMPSSKSVYPLTFLSSSLNLTLLVANCLKSVLRSSFEMNLKSHGLMASARKPNDWFKLKTSVNFSCFEVQGVSPSDIWKYWSVVRSNMKPFPR